MRKQDYLRKEVKLAKALNDDIYYKTFSDYLKITEHSFYNWLNGYYDLSKLKELKLHDILIDLIE